MCYDWRVDGAHDLELWLKIFRTESECQKRWLAGEKAKELGRGGVRARDEITVAT